MSQWLAVIDLTPTTRVVDGLRQHVAGRPRRYVAEVARRSLCYLPFLRLPVDSLTVVFGLRATVDFVTKRPVIALRPRLLPWPAMLTSLLHAVARRSAHAYWVSCQVTALPL